MKERKDIRTHLTCKVILLLLLQFLSPYAHSQEYNFRTITSGLAQSYVYSVIQDAQGYLWVGTGDGLSRYNGFIFKSFTIRDSLADNFITCSVRDGEGLWLGHNNGRLTFYDGKKFHPVIYPGEKLSSITHFAKSPDGQIWISTLSDGLFKLEKDEIISEKNITTHQQLIYSFDFLNADELLIGTASGLIHCKINNTREYELIGTIVEIPDSKITAIQKMINGSGFYIATENDGIYRLTYNNTAFSVLKIFKDPATELTGIQNIYEDSQSNLWAGTFGNGLIKMVPTATGEMKITSYNKANGFSADNIKTVYEDREGNIWSGNFGEGLTQITPKPFTLHSFDKTKFGNTIFSICLDRQYRWLGTDKGLLKTDRLNERIIKFYSKIDGLPKDTVSALYSPDGEELWIGTQKNGLFHMKSGNDKIANYPVGNGVLENSIATITGKGDQVWIGTQKGLFGINSSTGKLKEYSISQGGLPHNSVNSLFLDKKGKLWVSTNSSILAFIQDEKVNKIHLSSGTGILTLGPVTEDTDSRIWVGTKGSGVYIIQSDSIFSLTTKEGLISDYCYSLVCDDRNNIWVGHKSGLSRIRTSDFLVKPVQQIEDASGDFKINPNAITKDKDGKIWFGSDKGLISYDPSMELPQSIPPVLGITSIKINDDEKDISDNKINLSPGKYKIKIDFLGISLKEPQLVTYQYKLDGYDQWSEITKNTSVTYYHLTEGVYSFILKASSGDGVVTKTPLSISFLIEKPVWKKWWFYPAAVLILTLLTYFYIKRRLKRLIAEKRILEEKVEERTYEIQGQKNEIELQRDEIKIKNASITSSINYARHIQNTVLPHMELINKLLPDSFILSKPKDIVSGDFYWLTESDDKIIVAVADCTGHGVPGAFMSLLGITLLNEIVNIQRITSSDDIVTALRERVINALQQTRKDITTTDGMDISLCVLAKNNSKLQFTGAKNDLVYVRESKLEVIKADHFDVSVTNSKTGKFNKNELDFRKGDVLYLFSDGYQDQFGGDFDKKFLRPHFINTLFEIHKLPMVSQKAILEKKLHEWMKFNSQTDDITVMGIRL